MKRWIQVGALSIGLSGVGGYYLSVNQKERFIISEFEAVGVQSVGALAKVKEHLSVGAMAGEKAYVKDLKNKRALIAKITQKKAKELELEFGVVVEKDQRMSLVTGCAPKPNPGPPPPEPDDRAQEIPWGIKAIAADKAWAKAKGENSLVCVVDTGVEPNHPDLDGNIDGGMDFTGTGYYFDDNGHGTHVAGTIAALDNEIGVVGVAPKAKVYAVKVLDHEGSGWTSDIADGILECVHQSADVINLSLGGPNETTVMRDAIKVAVENGVIVVAAAGNEASAAPSYPASYPDVLAISAVDESLKLASFSNFGGWGLKIAYAAPGEDVLSTVPGWKYESFSGTSMASPHVAGVVALLISAGKFELKSRDIGLSESHQGKGLIDALGSVE